MGKYQNQDVKTAQNGNCFWQTDTATIDQLHTRHIQVQYHLKTGCHFNEYTPGVIRTIQITTDTVCGMQYNDLQYLGKSLLLLFFSL